MKLLDEIRKSSKKSKELITFVSKLILEKKPSSKDFSEALNAGNDSERGTIVESLEFATQTKPDIVKLYLPEVIKSLSDKAPRVKWEAARVIGNIAAKLPEEAAKTVDNLLINTKDKGTVVRWSVAFALGEIAKTNSKLQKNLVNEINNLLKRENNNGVKNVYLKALKVIDKQ